MHPNRIFPNSKNKERVWARNDRHQCDDTDQLKMFNRVNIGNNRQVENTGGHELQVDGYRTLILDRIQHLVRPELPLGSSTISMRVLPGVFAGFDQILGSPARIEYDAVANRLTRLYSSDAEAAAAGRKLLMCSLLIDILPAFDPYARRASWFLKIVNDSLDAGLDTARGPGASGISEADLGLLLRTLCLDLRCDMVREEGRTALEDRYGSDKILVAERVLDALWRPILQKRLRYVPSSEV